MNEKEAYRAVFYFYEQLAYENRDSLISVIHGDMQLLQDGGPADRAIEGDWKKSLAKTSLDSLEEMSSENVYEVARNLVEVLYEANSAKPQELINLINRLDQHGSKVDEYWMKALERAKTDEESIKLKLG